MKYQFNLKSISVEFTEEILKNKHSFYHVEGLPEKGGILMGELFPNKNLIVITNLIEVPSLNRTSVTYEMDMQFTHNIINETWTQSGGTITYIGDWHTHPEYNPKPSFKDYITFSKNFFQSSINQNFLIYIIFGYEYGYSKWVGLCNGIKTKSYIIKNDCGSRMSIID